MSYMRVLGIAIGVNAAVISIVTEWLSDIKMGYCSDGWWLNQQFCCWEIDDEGDTCEAWHQWSTAMPARWAIYVLFAVRAAHCVTCDMEVSFLMFKYSVGRILLHCGASSAVISQICRGFWYLRDQVHYWRIHHEGLLGILDVPRQEYNAGTHFFLLAA